MIDLSFFSRSASTDSYPQALSICRVLLTALAVVLLPTMLFADIFELEDGKRFEGTIVRESGALVSIRTSDGKVIMRLAKPLANFFSFCLHRAACLVWRLCVRGFRPTLGGG